MDKKIVIKSCGACPFRQASSDCSYHICAAYHYNKLVDTKSIPDFCPLENNSNEEDK